MMGERGVHVDHATVHRWALKMLPVLAAVFRRRQHAVGRGWRMDETYVLVAGRWKYLYRAVDLHDVPETITIDKSGANAAAARGLITDSGIAMKLRQSKYLSNVVEQEHRDVKGVDDEGMRRQSFSSLEFAGKRHKTRREKFLGEMGRVVPWSRLMAVIEPHYPKSSRVGCPPIGLPRMLASEG